MQVTILSAQWDGQTIRTRFRIAEEADFEEIAFVARTNDQTWLYEEGDRFESSLTGEVFTFSLGAGERTRSFGFDPFEDVVIITLAAFLRDGDDWIVQDAVRVPSTEQLRTNTGDDEKTGGQDGDIVPKLVQEQEGGTTVRELEPISVTRLGGTLPWDTDSIQLQCGETVTDNSGDMNIRLNYEAILTHTQFKTLNEMRTGDVPTDDVTEEPASTTVKLVSNAYNGPVTFDQLKFDRIADANGAITQRFGEVKEALYKIQLQTKETGDDDFEFIQDN